MEKWKACKIIWQHRSFRWLILGEIWLLLVLCGLLLVRKEQTYTWNRTVWQIDQDGNAYTEGISLPRGIYRVQVEYSCDSAMQHFCGIEKLQGSDGTVYCSGEHFHQGLERTDFDLWIVSASAQIVVKAEYGGGRMELGDIQFFQTDRDIKKALFLLAAASFIINGGYWFWICSKEGGLKRKQQELIFGLFSIIIVSSIPIFNNHIYAGSDITYHLLRIGNIKDGFLSGQFPVRIDPFWLYGNGYASSICYGEIFLYFPAFLRMIGFTLQGSWMWFLFALNIATCLVSYGSFKGIFQSKKIGFVCSALYTMSLYRLFKMYSWSAIGEVQAMVFLPLILYAVYQIFTKDAKAKSYQKYWLPLALGISGIIQCHVLTCEMTVFFLGLTCIFLWKKTFRKPTILVFLKAIGAVLFLNAWFLVPFFDYMLNMDMIIHHVSARTIQENGLYLAQLLFGFFHRGDSRDLVNNGLLGVEAMGVGFALVFGLGVFLLLWIWQKSKEKTSLIISAGKLCAVLAMLAMAMSLAVFPWTQIQFLNPFIQVLVSSIQYPNRFLMIATLLLTMTAGCSAVWLKELGQRKQQVRLGAVLLGITLVLGIFYLNNIVLQAGVLKIYDEKGMGSGYLSGAEYLPYGTDQTQLSYHAPIGGEGVVVKSSVKEYLDTVIECENKLKKESYVDAALLNYKGYQAVCLENGRYFPIKNGENGCVRVMVPAEFKGRIYIFFQELWYWKAANIISIIAAAGIIISCICRHRYITAIFTNKKVEL